MPTAPAGCLPPPGYGGPGTVYDMLAPAGDVLTEGVPAATFQPGLWQFRSNVLVLGADPNINTSAFATNLTNAVRDIMGGVATVAQNETRIDKGRQANTSVPRSGVARVLPNRDVPSWWITVQGQVNATGVWQLDKLNQAISRALAQSTSWTGFVDDDYRSKIPRDGGQLHAQFRASDACSGGANLANVMARACTRVAAVTVPATTTTPQTQQPAMPEVGQGGPGLPSTANTCAIRTASEFWLRPEPTFNRVGPHFQRGTAVTVYGPARRQDGTEYTQGSLKLYRVSVAGNSGFAAFSAADMATCPMYAPRSQTGGGGGSTTAPRPSSTSIVPRPPVQASIMGTGDTGGSSSTLLWGGLAFAAVAAGATAFVKRDDIAAWWHNRNKKRGAQHSS